MRREKYHTSQFFRQHATEDVAIDSGGGRLGHQVDTLISGHSEKEGDADVNGGSKTQNRCYMVAYYDTATNFCCGTIGSVQHRRHGGVAQGLAGIAPAE